MISYRRRRQLRRAWNAAAPFVFSGGLSLAATAIGGTLVLGVVALFMQGTAL
ncbi:MAG: hypothetical protein WC829_14355 [Hyphomicrobium sp.]